MYNVIIGRSEADRKKFGTEGTVLLGKQYVRMGATDSLSNKVYLDVSSSHVVFVCGKRGNGKSYSLGVIAEGITSLPREERKHLAVVILDTMGIYWTMKHGNKQDKKLLKEWGLEGKGLDVSIFVPQGSFEQQKSDGLPADFSFSINPMELSSEDWKVSLGLSKSSEPAVLLDKVVSELKDSNKDYGLRDIVSLVEKSRASSLVKDDLFNRFAAAEEWGLFSESATPIDEIAKPGRVSVVDVSCYNKEGGWTIKSLAVGLIAEKLFSERMEQRKKEEFAAVEEAERFSGSKSKEYPLVWLVIDEAHEFLPRDGRTLASEPLITILREGRQPGISLVLASQQPGKIHTDVLTQADTVISHRITAKIDTEALGVLMQSYMRQGLAQQLDHLPRTKGAALVFDDTNERIYPIQVRPRTTWHGGSSPSLL